MAPPPFSKKRGDERVFSSDENLPPADYPLDLPAAFCFEP
jgi:hypothetical protein